MATVQELWKAKKVVSQSRGRAIFGAIGINKADDDMVEIIAAIDALMTAKGIKDASEAVRRYQAGERTTKQHQTNGNVQSNHAAQNAKSTQLALVETSAERKAAGIEIASNLRTAQYLTGQVQYSPEMQAKVDQSYQILEAALYGVIPEYEADNLLAQIEEQFPNALGGSSYSITALPESKEPASTTKNGKNQPQKN